MNMRHTFGSETGMKGGGLSGLPTFFRFWAPHRGGRVRGRRAVSGPSKSHQMRDAIRTAVEPVLEAEGFELVEVEWQTLGKRTVLRMYIDTIPPGTKEDGVTVDHCQKVSRTGGDLLDVEDIVPGGYVLEVSSPGVFRPLTKEAHFVREVGQRIKVKTFEKKDGRRVYTGVLDAVNEGRVVLATDDGQTFAIGLDEIAKANLEPVLEF